MDSARTPSRRWSIRLFLSLVGTIALIVGPLPQPASAVEKGFSSTANSLEVGANLSLANAPIQARASTSGEWERFDFVKLSDGAWSIRSIANNKYVTANLSLTNAPLQARATSVGAWEKFLLIDNGDATDSIMALANNKYVTANLSDTNAPLQARADVKGGWEKFFIPGVG